MFTKKDFDLAKKLYYPLKVMELCEEHQMKVDFKDIGGNVSIFLTKGGLTAAVIIYRHAKEQIMYCVEKSISQFEWEIVQRGVKK